mgnify:CR=1 FL=1
MKLVYWRRGDYTYCLNLDLVQAIEVGPGIQNEHRILFRTLTNGYSYPLPRPLNGDQIKILLTLLQSSFALNLDDAIGALLKEGSENEQREE